MLRTLTISYSEREMDKRLNDISFCKVRMDDILVSFINDPSYLVNVRKLLSALDKAGLKLKRDKCQFLLLDLRFRICKEGITHLAEKMTAK